LPLTRIAEGDPTSPRIRLRPKAGFGAQERGARLAERERFVWWLKSFRPPD
jgi:hypothetical protein